MGEVIDILAGRRQGIFAARQLAQRIAEAPDHEALDLAHAELDAARGLDDLQIATLDAAMARRRRELYGSGDRRPA